MYDLIVLGGGSGGLNVASAAAAVGAKVALVEKHHLGGECTHTACVPSKALIASARLAHQIRRAGEFGLSVPTPEVDFAAVMDRVRSVVESFAGSDSGESLRRKGIDVFRGSPRFQSYDTLDVDGQPLNGSRFVIATGSRPMIPEIPGLAGSGYLDNTSIWNLRERPASLAILGGGAVGVELGQALARLGVPVTIIERAPHLLEAEDPDAGQALTTALESESIEVATNAEVTGIDRRDNRKVVKYRSHKDGAMYAVEAAELLVATGRLANVEGLNLEVVGIHADAKHGIPVNDHLQTTAPNIWAIGDVIGRNRWTHAAEREASVAFQNAVLRLGKAYDDSAMPRAVFTDPEVASVGLTEPQARDRHGDDLRILRADFDDLDRARIDGTTAGFAKVIATPNGRILGAVIVGPDASLVLQELVLAMQHGLGLNEIADTVHTYPTMVGMARKLANQFAATRLEKGYIRTALRWIFGYKPSGNPRESAGAGSSGG